MIDLLAQVSASTPPAAGDSVAQILTVIVGALGGVAGIVGVVKGIGGWLRDQLDKKDALLAAKDALLAAQATAHAAELARRDADADAKREALRVECRDELKQANDRLMDVLQEIAGHTKGAPA